MPRSSLQRLKRDTFLTAVDYWMLIPILTVTLIGLYVLNQVLSEGFGDLYPMNFYRQLGAVFVGLVLVLLICLLEAPILRLLGWTLYCLSLALLIYVRIDNFSMEAIWGADRWMQIPYIGTFQPSELVKVGLPVVIAQILEAMRLKRLNAWTGALALSGVALPPLLLIMMQPDFGTAMALIFMIACMLFVWGIRWRLILLGLSSIILAGPAFWFFYLADWQKTRIITFLFPGHNPDASFNLNQSRQAIASGGLYGSQLELPVHVPVKESDFIYVAVSEHMGFLGTSILLLLVFVFLIRSLYVACKLIHNRPAMSYGMTGLTSVLAIQYIENLGMTVGIMPITGIPLPFVSLGGTAMIVNFTALGIMLNTAIEQKTLVDR